MQADRELRACSQHFADPRAAAAPRAAVVARERPQLTGHSLAAAITGVGTIQGGPFVVGVSIEHLEGVLGREAGEAVQSIGRALSRIPRC
jgi:hypothetical protein